MKARVEGLERFVSEMNRRSQETKQQVDNEVKFSALRVEKSAKRKSPVDTDHLRSSIQAFKAKPLEAEVRVPVRYAIYVEKGTRKMRPQPYLKPALIEEKPHLVKRLQSIMKE